MAQIHSGFTVPAPSLSYVTPLELADAHCRVQVADVDAGSGFAQQAEGLKLWTTILWIHEQDLTQAQRDQLEKVSREHVGLADNKVSFKAIAETQERIRMVLRLYEKERGNVEAKKLRARKEGMDRSKGRPRQVTPQLGRSLRNGIFNQTNAF